MALSVIQGGAIVLDQNVIYRARLEVVSPYGAAAGQGAVRSALEEQGFRDITFYDRDRFPPDWPPDQAADDSGFMGKSFYLEGRFSLTARRIALTELGSKVNLRAMWVYLVPNMPAPAPAPAPGPMPQVVPPPVPSSPDMPISVPPPVIAPPPEPPPEELSAGTKLIASAAGVIGAYALFTWICRRL